MDNSNDVKMKEQDRMRKEVLDELNHKGDNVNKNLGEIKSFGAPKQYSNVHFAPEKEQKSKKEQNQTNVDVNPKSKGSLSLLVICSLIVLVCIMLFPTVSKRLSAYKNAQRKPVVKEVEEPEKEYEKITLDSEIVQNLKYPVMHNDRTNNKTYYTNDKLTIGSFSNNDILYNALLDIYEGNMAKYSGGYSGKYCGSNNNKVSLSARYIKMRIENLYTRNAKYSLTDFVVPSNNTDTKYIGAWRYNANENLYVYYGNCGSIAQSNIEYYDIKVPFEATSSDKNVEIYVDNYVAFAVVNKSAKSYTLYKNANYTEELKKGSLKTNDYQNELTDIVKNLDKNNVKKYRFTFTIDNCAYQDYCFYGGSWQN